METIETGVTEPEHVESKKTYGCSDCNEFFQDRFHLKVHKVNVHLKKRTYKCDICKENYEEFSQWKNHVECVHLANKNEETKVNELKIINVIEKSTTFKSKEQSLRVRLNEVNKNLVDSKGVIGEGKKYKCRFCNEAFEKVSDVQEHVTTQHFEDTVVIEPKNDTLNNDFVQIAKSNSSKR